MRGLAATSKGSLGQLPGYGYETTDEGALIILTEFPTGRAARPVGTTKKE